MPSYNKDQFRDSNVNYLNKDFTSLKQSLIDYAQSYFSNTYKDFNETSPGMMLIEMSAYVGDVLSFYIDQQYREMMLPLAEERRNIVNMAKMFGYKVKPVVPAYVDITFTQLVNSQTGNESQIDYSTATTFDRGIKVTSTTDSDIIFETLDVIDFTITSSTDTETVATINNDTGLASTYRLSRTVKAISGETKTATFNVGKPSKFLKLTLPETNVIDVIKCTDNNGNKWHQVDYLAQDKVPIETHYTSDEDRQGTSGNQNSAYLDLTGDQVVSEVAIPYSLSYIQTNKRFTVEVNEDDTTSLVFGNGILRNGNTIDNSFLDLEQAGIVIPGQSDDLDDSINPILGDEYSTLGETPVQTTLTVEYRIGGGLASNVSSADLTTFSVPSIIGGYAGTLETATNKKPATGGKNQDSIDEIRERTKSFFSTQNRCVTKEDYEARALNVPAKFGNIAKVYVNRKATTGQTDVATYDSTVTSIVNDFTSVQNEASGYFETQEGAGGSTTYGQLTAALNNLQTSIQGLPDQLLYPTLGTINIYVLAYNRSKNLVGNPKALDFNPNKTDNIPTLLLNNLSNYISNFRILTDSVDIQDGFIINFGVVFDVVAHRYANKKEVKLRCIQAIKKYFNIDRMQFSQPIYTSQLEYELMSIDGVRAVNYVCITQTDDYLGGINAFTPSLYTYQFNPETEELTDENAENAQSGYGYFYDFETAYQPGGIILPPNPSNPGVFELKNPNQNIKGVVR